MRRNLYDPLLLQHHIFGQHSVEAAAERTCVHVRGRLAGGPALEEAAGHLVADLNPLDAGADLDHLAGAVGQRDDVVGNWHTVGTTHDTEVAEVERAGHDLDQHLAIGWLRIGPLNLDQRVDAGTAFRQLIGTHVLSFSLQM